MWVHIMNSIKYSIILLLLTTSLSAKKNIIVLATDGAVAEMANLISQDSNYKPAKQGINQLLQNIPQVQNIANITGEQINQTTKDLSSNTLLPLARRVQEIADSSEVESIVIVYNAENLGATAYFLNLVVHTTKPIVVIKARSSKAPSNSNENTNLYQGLLVATNKESSNKGVLVLTNNTIFSARDVVRPDTLLVSTFTTSKSGALGYINNSKVTYSNTAIRLHTTQSEFNIKDINELPLVDIFYGFAEANSSYIKYANHLGIKGVVYAGISGNGNLYFNVINSLHQVEKKGMVVVRSSRVASRVIVRNNEIGNNTGGFVASGNLSPQKSRILLMLGLTKSSNAKYIQELFDKY